MSRLDLPPVWGAAAMAAIWAWAEAATLLPVPVWGLWLGRAAILGGVALAGWAALFFLRRRTPIEPRRTPTALITEGPYRLTRNPIYRGLVMVVAGWALVCGEATGLAIAAAYARVLWTRFVLPEEAALRAQFGPAYEAWAARTRWRL